MWPRILTNVASTIVGISLHLCFYKCTNVKIPLHTSFVKNGAWRSGTRACAPATNVKCKIRTTFVKYRMESHL